MLAVRFRIPWGIFGLISALSCGGASFGTVVPIHGTVSDIARDERHNVVWPPISALSRHVVFGCEVAEPGGNGPRRLSFKLPPSSHVAAALLDSASWRLN